jgi:tRNA 2-thiouridine synthesizing protein A
VPPSLFSGRIVATTGIEYNSWKMDRITSETDSQDGSASHEGVGPAPDVELDLRGVICPYNFVKTKLKLEAMEPGQVLAVILDDGDPIHNVPRSVSDDGHTVLHQERWAEWFRVIIRRRADF